MRTVKQDKLTFYYDVEQGTQEWLDLRMGRITCSNALTLMNKGKNACIEANRLAAERITPNGNFYAERGHVIEHELKEAYNRELAKDGLILEECGFITNDDYPMAGYSPDGLICELKADGTGDTSNIKALAEFKAYNDIVIRDEGTPNEHEFLTCKHRKACEAKKNIPPQAIAQCNMAMLLTGADVVYLFLCNPDAKQTDEMIEKLRKEHFVAMEKFNQALASASTNPKYLDKVRREFLRLGDEVDNIETGLRFDSFKKLSPTPITKVWKIKRNETIINRLIKKLS